MKNISHKNQNLVMSPSYSITEASLLDIFANLSQIMILSEYATSLLIRQRNFKDTNSSGNPYISKGGYKDYRNLIFFLIFSKTKNVISVFKKI